MPKKVNIGILDTLHFHRDKFHDPLAKNTIYRINHLSTL